jgi:predicted RNA-binding Zn-ribbon protein involved in translation (DUF1610 family)
MIQCPWCGGWVGDTLVCHGCQYSFREPAIIELYRQRVFCPDCGAENHNYSRRCHRCHGLIQSDAQLDALYARVLSHTVRARASQVVLAGPLVDSAVPYREINVDQPAGTLSPGSRQAPLHMKSMDPTRVMRNVIQNHFRVQSYCHACGTPVTVGFKAAENPHYCPQCGIGIDETYVLKMLYSVLRASLAP